MTDHSALLLMYDHDWEAFLNFGPQGPASPLHAEDSAPESSTAQPDSFIQNQFAFGNAPFDLLEPWVHEPPEIEDPQRNVNGVRYVHSETQPVVSLRDSNLLLETESPHDNSLRTASSTVSGASSLNSAKRKIDELSSSFFTAETQSQHPRKRQAFTPERRQQVARTRKNRACQRCKMRKLSCEASGSCEHCITSIGSTIVGEHICIRLTLEELRFRGADLLHEGYDKFSVKNFLNLASPASRTVYLRFRSYYTGVSLPLEVCDYSQNPRDDDEVVSYALSVKSPNEPRIPRFSKLSTPKYAILDHSLPSVQQLEEWIQQQMDPTEHAWSPSAMLFSSFRSLLTAYLNIGGDLPSQGIVKAALRVMNLYECIRNILIVEGENPDENLRCISKTAGIQIALVARQGITECEMDILSELDALVQKSKRPSKENEFPTWVGFWTLLLFYRDILRRYRYLSHSDYYPKGHFDAAIGLAKHMYHALTSIYNYLFRNRHPLSINWHEEENFVRLGQADDRNRILVQLDIIKERTRCFFESYKHDEDDSIMRALIMEEKYLSVLSPQSARVPVIPIQENNLTLHENVRHRRELSSDEYCQCWQ